MQTYPINELERLTGVKAHTIRIWEKRYNLITPDRTDTNRRYYNDDQVRKLLNVTTLMAYGHKISKIASYSDDEMHSHIQQQMTIESQDNIGSGFINDLLKTMLEFDEAGFEKIFSAVVTRFGLFEGMLQVVYPFLNKVGVLWSVDKTAPVQEHFATCIIRRKLMAAIDGLLPATVQGQKFLLFLPEEEWHEIGLLFSSYVIRSKGYDALYLGQNVPTENIVKICGLLKPDYILTFYVAARPSAEIDSQLKSFAKSCPNAKILIAGNKELLHSSKAKFKTVTYLTSVHDLLSYL